MVERVGRDDGVVLPCAKLGHKAFGKITLIEPVSYTHLDVYKRQDLAVNAIIKEEKLEATDEEVEKQYNDLAEKYSMDVGELKKLSLIHI